MNIQRLVVGPFEVNCYLVWDSRRRAIVIDPGAEPDRILASIAEQELRVLACLATHGHMDHIGALAAVAAKASAPVGIGRLEIRWAFSPANQMPPYYTVPQKPAEIGRLLEDRQQWMDGDLDYEVIATPGHSPGSVCLHFPAVGALFSGDTLFQGTVGRTDVPGGDGRLLAQSLLKLAHLPTATRVYPGHGPETTLAVELQNNPFRGC